jgi:hypothetical protein
MAGEIGLLAVGMRVEACSTWPNLLGWLTFALTL